MGGKNTPAENNTWAEKIHRRKIKLGGKIVHGRKKYMGICFVVSVNYQPCMYVCTV